MSLRVLMPIVSLAIGTWLGLGQPDLDAMTDAARRLYLDLAGDPRLEPPPRGPIVLDRVPQTLEVRALGQFVPEPLPRLNPEARTSRAWLLAEGPFYPANENKRLVTFTFDADGSGVEHVDAHALRGAVVRGQRDGVWTFSDRDGVVVASESWSHGTYAGRSGAVPWDPPMLEPSDRCGDAGEDGC